MFGGGYHAEWSPNQTVCPTTQRAEVLLSAAAQTTLPCSLSNTDGRIHHYMHKLQLDYTFYNRKAERFFLLQLNTKANVFSLKTGYNVHQHKKVKSTALHPLMKYYKASLNREPFCFKGINIYDRRWKH